MLPCATGIFLVGGCKVFGLIALPSDTPRFGGCWELNSALMKNR
jgi:hypothetical protein